MSSTITKLNVEGMSCGHCEKTIKNTTVDLKDKSVTVEDEIDLIAETFIKQTIEEVGYEVN